jgi:eukaryotic-like serine/threonine-protein kinase
VLYDAGLAEGGRPYLALEYVDGVPIDAYCRDQPLPEVLRLMVQVVRAVAYAHGQLVIHRDLKPANVLVKQDGSPKLLDFGISKLIEGDTTTTEASALTRLAGRPMTLAYAAPEQVLALPITVAADVYALGVMLAELLAGARLYRASEPRSLEAEILTGDLRTPSAITADKARAKLLKGDLDAIAATALKRYGSAAALADDLERYLDGKPVRAQPDSRAYRLTKFVQRNTLPVAAGSAIVLALGIGLGVALWQATEARQQAARATALNTFVLGLIRTADPNASAQTKAADVALLNTIEERIDREFHGSPDQLLQLRVTVGDAYRNRGQHVAARRVYRRAIGEAETALPADDLGLLKARVARAAMATADDEALQSLDATISLLRRSGPAAIEPLIDALLARVESVKTIGPGPRITWDLLYADAKEAYDSATRHAGTGSAYQLRAARTLAYVLGNRLGSSRSAVDRAEEAFKVLEDALAAARSNPALTEGNVDRLDAELRYGALLCKYRSIDEGMRRLWQADALGRKHHGEDSLPVEVAHYQLGECLWERDDPEAVWLKASAYRMAASRGEQSEWVLALLADEVAILHLNARRAGASAEFATKASIPAGEIRSRMLSSIGLTQVGGLIQQGKPDEAEALADQLLIDPRCCEQSLHMLRSEALRLSGRFEAAALAADQAVSIARAKRVDGLELAQHLTARGSAELESNHRAQALATLEEAISLAPLPQSAVFLSLVYGRALLANGHAAEALEALRQSYGFWLGHDPRSVWAAEAEYWFGQARIAIGDVKRGRWMVAEAQRALAKSPFKVHQRLVASSPKVAAAVSPSSR